jgi:conjugative transfer pilus assembly protein TraH
MLSSIAVKLRAGTPYGTDETAFLTTVPASVLVVMKAAVAANNESQVVGQLSEIVAKLYAYSMLTDLFGRTTQMIALANHIATSAQGSAAGKDEKSCQKEMFADVVAKFQALDEKVYSRMKEIRQSIASSTEQLNAMQALFNNYSRFQEIARSELSNRFSRGVANHISQGS